MYVETITEHHRHKAECKTRLTSSENIKPIIKVDITEQPNEIAPPVYAFSGVKTITLNNFPLSPYLLPLPIRFAPTKTFNYVASTS